ncbi:hypothetical protein CHELA40_13088 [Chelatococcus asaccharovorans]|nr:hypothetical protein CHELA40_13088 [Chelatococcus asaccharovorans]CAH1680404.1 hypothetical protein CHELA17_62532 [Chelatococcus asaccharovorans]
MCSPRARAVASGRSRPCRDGPRRRCAAPPRRGDRPWGLRDRPWGLRDRPWGLRDRPWGFRDRPASRVSESRLLLLRSSRVASLGTASKLQSKSQIRLGLSQPMLSKPVNLLVYCGSGSLSAKDGLAPSGAWLPMIAGNRPAQSTARRAALHLARRWKQPSGQLPSLPPREGRRGRLSQDAGFP